MAAVMHQTLTVCTGLAVGHAIGQVFSYWWMRQMWKRSE